VNALNEKIKAARKKSGLTLEGLAKKTGSCKSYIWELENRDVVRPSAEKLLKIAEVLGVTPQFLMNDQAKASESDEDLAFFERYKKLDEKKKETVRKILDIFIETHKDQ